MGVATAGHHNNRRDSSYPTAPPHAAARTMASVGSAAHNTGNWGPGDADTKISTYGYGAVFSGARELPAGMRPQSDGGALPSNRSLSQSSATGAQGTVAPA